MPYQTPAPRYARRRPASPFPPVMTPYPRHRPLLQRAVALLRDAAAREARDHAFALGAGFGLAFAAMLVAGLVLQTA